MYHKDANFWELGDYKDAHLSRLIQPDDVIEKINNWWKNPNNFFVFLGNAGCGKTYLVAAMIHALLEDKDKKNHFRYFHEKDFYSKMRQIVEKGWDYEYEIKRLCETYMIFIDDIGASQGTPFQKECVFNLIDQRSISQLPTVVISNLYLKDFSREYPERFVSRLKNKKNTIIELNWIDKRQE